MLTLADYAVIAAKEELDILWDSRNTQDEVEATWERIYKKLQPLADQGHVGSQLFLATELPSFTVKSKKWLIQAANAGNSMACFHAACNYFCGRNDFEQDFVLAANYLTKALESNDAKVLHEIKDGFGELCQDDSSPVDKERISKLVEKLKLHNIDLYAFLKKELPYLSDEPSDDEAAFLSAAENGQYEFVRDYLKRGGNPHIKDGFRGESALHKAASKGHKNIVAAILHYYRKYSLPVDSIAFERQDTPLSLACAADHGDIVEMLLNAGANPFRKNTRYNYNAFGRASRRSCENALKVLNQYTKESGVSSNFKENSLDCTLCVDIGVFGARKENFIGQIRMITCDFQRSSDIDPLFYRINDYLKSQNVPLLDKKYSDDGSITTELSSLQGYHVLHFIEANKQISDNIQYRNLNAQENTAPMTLMKNRCKWSFNPDLVTLCVRSIVKNGVMSELAKLSKFVDLPKYVSEKDAAMSVASVGPSSYK